MLETILLGIVGFILGVGIHRTVKEMRDRKALRGGGLTIEKKLIAATVKLKAAEQQNDEMRSYLGLNPIRREALVGDEPVVSKKARAKKGRNKKKDSDLDSLATDLKGLGVGSGSIPMLMLIAAGTAMIADQQKKKAAAQKSKEKLISDYAKSSSNKMKLKDIKARLQKQAGELVDVLSEGEDSELDK